MEEFEKLCDKMQWQEGWTWQDMPVEMAHLLYDRVQIFLRDHLLHPTNPILGPIKEYTIRWESQVRWLHRCCMACYMVHPSVIS